MARRAAEQVGAKGLVLGGGVAANSLLRERFLSACTETGIQGFLPSREMCTDNAAMIAARRAHARAGVLEYDVDHRGVQVPSSARRFSMTASHRRVGASSVSLALLEELMATASIIGRG